ncbi:hypothetical protein HK100_012907 [Physocladia obscura]|uniref:Uncharacterized protein n=1 Tax=Physocladia obscura TaxID=109957 RepID=A0AAD5XFI8_9FUNG|nr:hypothetical protein HK100_012907 [Physocladia obscura]
MVSWTHAASIVTAILNSDVRKTRDDFCGIFVYLCAFVALARTGQLELISRRSKALISMPGPLKKLQIWSSGEMILAAKANTYWEASLPAEFQGPPELGID